MGSDTQSEKLCPAVTKVTQVARDRGRDAPCGESLAARARVWMSVRIQLLCLGRNATCGPYAGGWGGWEEDQLVLHHSDSHVTKGET